MTFRSGVVRVKYPPFWSSCIFRRKSAPFVKSHDDQNGGYFNRTTPDLVHLQKEIGAFRDGVLVALLAAAHFVTDGERVQDTALPVKARLSLLTPWLPLPVQVLLDEAVWHERRLHPVIQEVVDKALAYPFAVDMFPDL